MQDRYEQQWALRYRPRNFEQVVGQPEKAHLRAVLRQQNGFPPLVTFTGPSGTGKTTIARIVAMALNCLDLGPKGDPCGNCAACEAISEGAFSGVYEHNAALRNGAEHMRELQERAYLQPDGKYSVFILDEAQTLSSQAWKVLLKLFEEPPSGCVFILVTSEPDKIPRTIQTRAVQYDFGKVQASEIERFVSSILVAEGVEITGLDYIVDLAQGSVREAVMLAEQCVRSEVKDAFVLFNKRDTTLEIIEAATDNDVSKGLAAVEQMWRNSAHAPYIFEKIADQLQRVLYRHYGLGVALSATTAERIDRVARDLGEARLAKLMTIMAAWQPRVKTKAHLLFMWQEMVVALHGAATPKPSAPVVVKPREKPKPAQVSAEDIAASLKNFNLG